MTLHLTLLPEEHQLMRMIALAVAATLVGATATFAQVTPPAVTTPAEANRATASGFIEFQAADELLATDLLGLGVTNLAEENLGTVNNILYTHTGEAVAVIVGVGGFLGIGVKDVAISYDAVTMVVEDNAIRLVVDATREALDAATAFQTLDALGLNPMVPTEPAAPLPPLEPATPAVTPPAAAITPEPAPVVTLTPVPPAAVVAPAPVATPAPEPAPVTPAPEPAPVTPAAEPAPVTPAPEPAPVAAAPVIDAGPMVITAPPMVIAAPMANAPTTFLATQGGGEILVTDMIGRPVYNLAGEALGNITNVLQTRDGTITAAIVGVGGFLGIGVKDVAISMEALTIGVIDGEWRFVFNADRSALDAAPAFQQLP